MYKYKYSKQCICLYSFIYFFILQKFLYFILSMLLMHCKFFVIFLSNYLIGLFVYFNVSAVCPISYNDVLQMSAKALENWMNFAKACQKNLVSLLFFNKQLMQKMTKECSFFVQTNTLQRQLNLSHQLGKFEKKINEYIKQ